MSTGLITVSIVSHGHGSMLPYILDDLASCEQVEKIIVTRNISESAGELTRSRQVITINNDHPKGFGANHNAAFRQACTPYFLVLNPDVRFNGNPFPMLLSCLQDNTVALCAPAVIGPSGALEDSARQFPSIFDLIRKAIGRNEGRVHYAIGDPPRESPWVAGMFMLLRSSDYAALGGFDEGYFLYYEDVDLCARLWKSGRKVILCPSVHIVHDARRDSHRNLKYMFWHLSSILRYLGKHAKYALNIRSVF